EPVAEEPPIWEPAATVAEESSEETSVRTPALDTSDLDQPTPVPDEPDWQERHWDEEPPKRSAKVLVSSLIALLLVGGIVAAVVLLQDNDKDDADKTPLASQSATPSSSPTPGTPKVCQDGRTVEATERC